MSTGKLSSFAAPLEPGIHGETTMAPLVRRVAATLRNSWGAVQRWVQRGAVDDDAEVVWSADGLKSSKFHMGGGFLNMFYVHPYLGEDEPILTHIFQMGWNHRLVQF